MQLGNLAYAYFMAEQPSTAQSFLDALETLANTRFRAILERAGLRVRGT